MCFRLILQVCLSMGGVTPARSQSQMVGRGTPLFPNGGSPPKTGWGWPIVRIGWGSPPTPSGLDGCALCQDWMGGSTPPPALLGMDGVPLTHWDLDGSHLDRLCRGRFASCGFLQEDFRVQGI